VPGHRFVVYLQDHDQVGNRATGDRISATLSDGLLKVGAALVLTSPYTPMLWMGEEWGARTPWQFFSDHEGDLGEAVRQGRRAEFGSHGWDTEDVPDPQSEQTLRDSTLDWSEPEQERHAALLAWHRDLIALRRSRLELSDGRRDRVEVRYDEDARWLVVRRGAVAVAANLGGEPAVVPLPAGGRVLLASEAGLSVDGATAQLPAESVVVVELTG
jgi:maltooligosyltrehalose trehalohydrolase